MYVNKLHIIYRDNVKKYGIYLDKIDKIWLEWCWLNYGRYRNYLTCDDWSNIIML